MKQKTKILAAFAVASALIFASCSNSDSAMPGKTKNSAIAQPGEGLKIAVYTFDPGALDQSKKTMDGVEDSRIRSIEVIRHSHCAKVQTPKQETSNLMVALFTAAHKTTMYLCTTPAQSPHLVTLVNRVQWS